MIYFHVEKLKVDYLKGFKFEPKSLDIQNMIKNAVNIRQLI